MKAVVLGATGFLGRALADGLEASGYDIERLGSADLDLRASAAGGALAQRLGPDTILVVCSALTPPEGATLEGLRANLAMVASVAAAFEQAEVAACVYLSSDAVYGWSDEPVTERTPVQPVGYYPIAKYTGEMMLGTASATRGVPLLVLRPVSVFGPGDTHGAYGPNRFARTAREEGRLELFGEGEELRDHLYIDDFAAYATSLIDKRATGVFNLASGVARTFAEVAAALRRLSPRDIQEDRAAQKGQVVHRVYDIAKLSASAPEVSLIAFDQALRATLGSGATLSAGRPSEARVPRDA